MEQCGVILFCVCLVIYLCIVQWDNPDPALILGSHRDCPTFSNSVRLGFEIDYGIETSSGSEFSHYLFGIRRLGIWNAGSELAIFGIPCGIDIPPIPTRSCPTILLSFVSNVLKGKSEFKKRSVLITYNKHNRTSSIISRDVVIIVVSTDCFFQR